MILDLKVLINTVSTMFLLLLIGYIARKLKFTNDSFSKGLSNMIIKVAQPFMIISSVVSIPYSDENLNTGLFVLVLGIAVHMITAVIAFLATFKMRDNDERRITEFGMIFANCGFLGFPILKSLFGNIGVFWGSFYVIVFNIVTWTYGMFVLGKARPEIKMSFKKMILNYGTTPCIIGLALFLIRIPLPSPLVSAMDYMGSLCTPVSMYIIGGLLATISVKKLFVNAKVYYVCAVRLLIISTIVTLCCKLVGLTAEMTLFATTMASLPVASNTGMFAEIYDLKPEYAAHIVGMSTLLSAITVPVMIMFANMI